MTAAERVAFILSAIKAGSEPELHESISVALGAANIDFLHEVILSKKDRIDFMVNGVGIEVKNKCSLPEIIRQLHRYAKSDKIDSLVLVTTKLAHKQVPKKMLGKDVIVLALESWI